MKVLYFEGAGLSDTDVSKATIGNCRIRTAFHLDDGQAVYLEIVGNEKSKKSNPDIYRWKYTGFVEACHYITDDKPNDDCNLHRIIFPGELECGGWVKARSFEYAEEPILKLVNSLGASFTAIKVVPDLGGYRVFPRNHACCGLDGYNYGDEFQFDPELIARREAVYKWVYDLEAKEMREDRVAGGNKFCHTPFDHDYPNFSLWVDEKDPAVLHLLRRFIGNNKHWTIRVGHETTLDDSISSMRETILGEYGC